MENYTLKKMIEIVGWNEPAEGIFCPGISLIILPWSFTT
jgi:hypothetical protein